MSVSSTLGLERKFTVVKQNLSFGTTGVAQLGKGLKPVNLLGYVSLRKTSRSIIYIDKIISDNGR